MQRLAALVPRPRLHLIRYHGVLAPNAKLRARSQRMGWARPLRRVLDIDTRCCPRCGGVQVKIIAAIPLYSTCDDLPPTRRFSRERQL
jgi:hypothetical protein